MRQKSLHYFLIILIFALGAAVGALFSHILWERAIWMAAGFLAAGFLLMFIHEEEKDDEKDETE